VRIAIIGAGPAGCHLAHRQQSAGQAATIPVTAHIYGAGRSNSGYEILLFDPRAPWEKPCGGGLSLFIDQHFPDVMALPFPRHRPSRLLARASDGSQVQEVFKQPPWTIVSRADFGRELLNRAMLHNHVRLVRQRVIDLKRAGEGWRVHTASGGTFSADFLVGADGVRSIVRRQVVGPIPHQHLGLTVGYRVQGAPDALVFQTFADLEGYLWSFPRRASPACPERSRGERSRVVLADPDLGAASRGGNQASVGIGSRLGAAHPRELWQRLDQFLDDECPGATKKSRWAALLPMARDSSLWDTPCVGPGWALLGDAAGHVHPITGEGIAYALWSAELLARAFGDIVKSCGSASHWRQYPRNGHELLLRHWLVL